VINISLFKYKENILKKEKAISFTRRQVKKRDKQRLLKTIELEKKIPYIEKLFQEKKFPDKSTR